MGLENIKQSIIKQVEILVNGEGSDKNNGVLEEHELSDKSVFAKAAEMVANANNMNPDDINISELFGAEFGETAQAPKKAGTNIYTGDGVNVVKEGDNEYSVIRDGDGTTYIDFGDTNINVSVVVKSDMQELVQKLIDAIKDNHIDIDMLKDLFKDNNFDFDKLKEVISDVIDTRLVEFLKGVFINYQKNFDAKFDQMLEFFQSLTDQLGIDIKQLGDVIAKCIDSAMSKIINRWGADFKELINVLKDMSNDQEETNQLLMSLYDAVGNLTNNFNDYSEEQKNRFTDLVKLVKEGNITAQEMKALLASIKNDTSENKEISKSILEAVNENTDVSKQILKTLAEFETKFSQYGADVKQKLDAILNKEIKVVIDGVKVDIDIDAILKKLDALIEHAEQNDEDNSTIIAKLDKLDKDLSEIQKTENEIKAYLKNLAQTNSEIKQNLAQYETQVTNLMNEIKEAISNIDLSVGDVSVNFDPTAIVDAVNKCTKAVMDCTDQVAMENNNLGSKLDTLTGIVTTFAANVKTGQEEDAKTDLAILEAIKNINIPGGSGGQGGSNVNYTEIFNKFLDKLDAIIANTENIKNNVSDIKTDVKTIAADIKNTYAAVLNIVNNLSQDSEFDPTVLYKKLDDILAAIKNHKVLVEIKNDGSAVCKPGEPVDEGEITPGEIDNLMNAPRRVALNQSQIDAIERGEYSFDTPEAAARSTAKILGIEFENPDTTGISSPDEQNNGSGKTGKNGKYLEDGQVVIYKNGVKYNTAGQKLTY